MNQIELTKKIILDPNNDSLYLKRGHEYFQEGCSEEAIKDYSKALELNPTNADSWKTRACAYEAMHNHAQAIEDFTKAINLNHECHYYYGLRAISYMRSGEHKLNIFFDTNDIDEFKFFDVDVIHDLSHAIRDFKKALKSYPSSTKEIEPLSLLAKSYKLCGNYYQEVYFRKFNIAIESANKEIMLKAINNYTKAINIDANDPQLYSLRGYCYYSLSTHQNILNHMKNTLLINNQKPMINDEKLTEELSNYQYLLNNDQILNHYHNAIKDYTKLIGLSSDIPKNYDPYFYRGTCYYHIGNYEKALEDFSYLKFNFSYFEISELGIKNTFIKCDEHSAAINTLQIIVNILENSSCPIDPFLKGLELIFGLKEFSFYNENFFKTCNEDLFLAVQEYNCVKYNEDKEKHLNYLIKYKLKILEIISKEILKEIFSLSQEKQQKEFKKYANITFIFFNINSCLQRNYEEMQEKIIRESEQKKAQAKIEERNKVIADLSHSIKNLISSVIDPLENLKKEVIAKQPIIDSAIKGANLVREIVNAMNLSYKGSIEDFRYDAKNNDAGDSQNVKTMIIESLKNAVANMYDGKYFSSFQEGYFPTKELYLESKSNWISITQSKSLDELCQFLHTYFFDLIISIENTERLVVGNKKGSIVKFFILFGELILNAVKYSAFVKRENRFVKIEVLYNLKDVSVLVENRLNPRKKVKTTGLGNVIITNFAKLLNTSPVINTENDIYSIKITFENFWQKGPSL